MRNRTECMKNKIALGIGISFVTASLVTLSAPAYASQGDPTETNIKLEKINATAEKTLNTNSTLKKIKKGKKSTTTTLGTKKTIPFAKTTKQKKTNKVNATLKKVKITNDKEQSGTPNGEMKKKGARRAPPAITP